MRPDVFAVNGAVIEPLAYAEDGRVFECDHPRHTAARCFADEGYFDEIRKTLDALEVKSLRPLRAVLVQARDALISRIKRVKDLPRPRDVGLKGMPAFRRAIRDLLQTASATGGRDAKREVRLARRRLGDQKRKNFKGSDAFTPRNAATWMREKEFFVTDLLDEAITKDVRGILVNALKTGELNDVVADKIWTAFENYIGDPDVLRDGEPLSAARLETIVRTNLTDAYNHGRMMEYTSDDMLPFLNAIRYSAILDSRTTEVCRFLDGKCFTPEDPDLTDLLPPNHFNCRSIVVPVVVGEAVNEDDYITPADVGFAKGLADSKFLAYNPDQVRDWHGRWGDGNMSPGRHIAKIDRGQFARLEPKEAEQLDNMYRSAAAAKDAFDARLTQIADQVGGKAELPPLKGAQRAVDKIKSDYNGNSGQIKDLIRGTIVVDNPRAAAKVLAAIRESKDTFEVSNKGFRNLLDPKANPDDGYRDAKMNVHLHGVMGEIQINVPAMLEAKHAVHGMYVEREKISRDAKDRGYMPHERERVNALNAGMKARYDSAWALTKDTNS